MVGYNVVRTKLEKMARCASFTYLKILESEPQSHRDSGVASSECDIEEAPISSLLTMMMCLLFLRWVH